MKGDFTRSTFDPKKNYRAVLMQQGRVQLDADWNEQLAIAAQREQTEMIDVIGPSGAPKLDAGFQIGLTPDKSDLTISAGRIYVDGILCELEPSTVKIKAVSAAVVEVEALTVDGRQLAVGEWVELLHDGAPLDGGPQQGKISAINTTNRQVTLASAPTLSGAARLRRLTTFTTQHDLPGEKPAPTTGSYTVVLDVWERHITALEDPNLREIALGGPDTTTRKQVVAQVKLVEFANFVGALSCENAPDWRALLPKYNGRLRARAHPEETEQDPCLTPASAGYRRLENQLYRVEVHRRDNTGKLFFKWSRDNGSVVTAWTGANNDDLQVASLGRDNVLGFRGTTWAELIDDSHELRGEPGTLVRVVPSSTADNTLTISTVAPVGATTAFADFPRNPKLRRWDSDGEIEITQAADNDGYLKLEGGVEVRFELDGDYQPGDYWLIPARTAIGDEGGDILWARDLSDPNNPQPLAVAADGIGHHYCLLAVWQPAISDPQDCRADFPSLTAICAEDVCYDNGQCVMPGVSNVQEALDYLCQGTDLRFHNKHLHGWGIVCGLQVACADNLQVRVRSGYAIDCEGRDVRLPDETLINLKELLAAHGNEGDLINAEGNGELLLTVAGGLVFAVEAPEKKKTPLQEILQGTLLLDFYNDCIVNLIDAFRKELDADDGSNEIVSGSQRRLISLTNLIVQLAQRTSGSRVFLSRREHEILAALYKRFSEILHSETFCALSSLFDQFPNYPFAAVQQTTIFGRGNPRRLRLNPNGVHGYSIGVDNKISIFDLREGRMIGEMVFPGVSGAVVQDVAVAVSGKELVAIATKDGPDTFFAVAKIDGATHEWGEQVIFKDVRMVTMLNPGSNRRRIGGTIGGIGRIQVIDAIVAVGKGKGLYTIARGANNQFEATLAGACNAVGQLTATRTLGIPFVYATVNTQSDKVSDIYDGIAFFHGDGVGVIVMPFTQMQIPAATGKDDITMFVDPQRNLAQVAVVLDNFGNNQNKHVLLLSLDGRFPGFRKAVPILENTELHLAYNPLTRFLMVAFEDSYRLNLIDLDKDELLSSFDHPVQLSPVALTMNVNNDRVYVVNAVSNTISDIDARYFNPTDEFEGAQRIDIATLQDYRTTALEAYLSLVTGVVQHIKDCFCDHLLVNCPECDEDDKLYLASITVRKGEVYKVCNFSKRKYVKTFPAMTYWWSILPLENMLHSVVERFCCLVLPDLVKGKFDLRGRPDSVKGSQLREGISFARLFDLGDFLGTVLKEIKPARQISADWLGGRAQLAANPDTQRVIEARPSSFVGQPTDLIVQQLAGKQVNVEIQPYDPTRGASNLLNYVRSSFASLPANAKVTIFEENGEVRSIAVEAQPAMIAPQTAVDPQLSKEVETLRGELAEIRLASQQALDVRNSEIATLRQQVARMAEAQTSASELLKQRESQVDELLAGFNTLRSEVTKLSKPSKLGKP